MRNRASFLHSIETAAEQFKRLDKKDTIRVISHIDADGISAVSLLIHALNKLDIKYSLSTVQQLDENFLHELQSEEYTTLVFCDLGSGHLQYLHQYLPTKKIFVLDHHMFTSTVEYKNITHINPHAHGIDGGKEISAAGVMYFFIISLDKTNEQLAHLALIGAIGDIQEHDGFIGLNNEILDLAVQHHVLEVQRGLRFFGTKTRPLYKLLEYSFDPFIPGVTGNEESAIQFLTELKIQAKKGNSWTYLGDLTPDQKKRLTTGIILKREREEHPEDIFGNQYIIIGEKFDLLTDAKEYSTLLNACGRLNKASLGIGACIGNDAMKKKAIQHLSTYRKEIVDAINWYHEHKDTERVIMGKGFIIINAQDDIPHTIIGTLASILSKSNEIEEGTYILSLAHTFDNKIKISLRIAGSFLAEEVDLRMILDMITQKSGGMSGGHRNAAGGIIAFDKEELFISAAEEILEQHGRAVEY